MHKLLTCVAAAALAFAAAAPAVAQKPDDVVDVALPSADDPVAVSAFLEGSWVPAGGPDGEVLTLMAGEAMTHAAAGAAARPGRWGVQAYGGARLFILLWPEGATAQTSPLDIVGPDAVRIGARAYSRLTPAAPAAPAEPAAPPSVETPPPAAPAAPGSASAPAPTTLDTARAALLGRWTMDGEPGVIEFFGDGRVRLTETETGPLNGAWEIKEVPGGFEVLIIPDDDPEAIVTSVTFLNADTIRDEDGQIVRRLAPAMTAPPAVEPRAPAAPAGPAAPVTPEPFAEEIAAARAALIGEWRSSDAPGFTDIRFLENGEMGVRGNFHIDWRPGRWEVRATADGRIELVGGEPGGEPEGGVVEVLGPDRFRWGEGEWASNFTRIDPDAGLENRVPPALRPTFESLIGTWELQDDPALGDSFIIFHRDGAAEFLQPYASEFERGTWDIGPGAEVGAIELAIAGGPDLEPRGVALEILGPSRIRLTGDDEGRELARVEGDLAAWRSGVASLQEARARIIGAWVVEDSYSVSEFVFDADGAVRYRGLGDDAWAQERWSVLGGATAYQLSITAAGRNDVARLRFDGPDAFSLIDPYGGDSSFTRAGEVDIDALRETLIGAWRLEGEDSSVTAIRFAADGTATAIRDEGEQEGGRWALRAGATGGELTITPDDGGRADTVVLSPLGPDRLRVLAGGDRIELARATDAEIGYVPPAPPTPPAPPATPADIEAARQALIGRWRMEDGGEAGFVTMNADGTSLIQRPGRADMIDGRWEVAANEAGAITLSMWTGDAPAPEVVTLEVLGPDQFAISDRWDTYVLNRAEPAEPVIDPVVAELEQFLAGDWIGRPDGDLLTVSFGEDGRFAADEHGSGEGVAHAGVWRVAFDDADGAELVVELEDEDGETVFDTRPLARIGADAVSLGDTILVRGAVETRAAIDLDAVRAVLIGGWSAGQEGEAYFAADGAFTFREADRDSHETARWELATDAHGLLAVRFWRNDRFEPDLIALDILSDRQVVMDGDTLLARIDGATPPQAVPPVAEPAVEAPLVEPVAAALERARAVLVGDWRGVSDGASYAAVFDADGGFEIAELSGGVIERFVGSWTVEAREDGGVDLALMLQIPVRERDVERLVVVDDDTVEIGADVVLTRATGDMAPLEVEIDDSAVVELPAPMTAPEPPTVSAPAPGPAPGPELGAAPDDRIEIDPAPEASPETAPAEPSTEPPTEPLVETAVGATLDPGVLAGAWRGEIDGAPRALRLWPNARFGLRDLGGEGAANSFGRWQARALGEGRIELTLEVQTPEAETIVVEIAERADGALTLADGATLTRAP